jgi:hypothetical protein
MEDLECKLRIVAQTTIGEYFISTVRSPGLTTFEICIFHLPTGRSELVQSYIGYRHVAFSRHMAYCEQVWHDGFVFEE